MYVCDSIETPLNNAFPKTFFSNVFSFTSVERAKQIVIKEKVAILTIKLKSLNIFSSKPNRFPSKFANIRNIHFSVCDWP